MVFGFGRDTGEPKTIELRSRQGETYWILDVPAKKVDKIVSAQKWGHPMILDFPVTEGARLIFNWEAMVALLVRDAPVDAGNNVFHYLQDAEEDED